MADDEKPQGAKADKAEGEPAKRAGQGSQGRRQGREQARRKDGKGAGKAARPRRPPPARAEGLQAAHEAHYERWCARDDQGVRLQNHCRSAVEKIVLNMGVGEAVNDRKKVDAAQGLAMIAGQRPWWGWGCKWVYALRVKEKKKKTARRSMAPRRTSRMIAGQRPVITRARKSIATYKVRDGMAIGAKVTLRGDRMYEFMDRLVTIALPRVKDFRGLNPKSFDGRGNFALGLQGAHRVPRDRLRPGRRDLGHGRDRVHHGRQRRRGARAAARLQFPVSQLGTRAAPAGLGGLQWPRQSSVNKNNRRRKLVGAVRGQAQEAEGRSPAT